jgi:hypothetical protein
MNVAAKADDNNFQNLMISIRHTPDLVHTQNYTAPAYPTTRNPMPMTNETKRTAMHEHVKTLSNGTTGKEDR